MDNLKPCPFCGCQVLYIVTVEMQGYETVGIFCNNCKWMECPEPYTEEEQ